MLSGAKSSCKSSILQSQTYAQRYQLYAAPGARVKGTRSTDR